MMHHGSAGPGHRKTTTVTPASSLRGNGYTSAGVAATSRAPLSRHHEMDFGKMFMAMERGHKVCKLAVLKKWDPAYKLLTLDKESRQIFLFKLEPTAVRCKPQVLDIRQIREVQTLDYKLNTIKIDDKWRKDREIMAFDPYKILIISYGMSFALSYWVLLYETAEACKLWSVGLHNLMMETRDRDSSPHPLRIERFIHKHYLALMSPGTEAVARKHMKPFVQTSLQFNVQSKELQEITEDLMTFEQFSNASRMLIHVPELFNSRFADLAEYCEKRGTQIVTFQNFLRFLDNKQFDELASNRTRAFEFLNRYLHQDHCSQADRSEPLLTVPEFCDFLFSRENSLWDPTNEKVTHDMTRPLSHYWIASSHNTYLTGDQLRSESSLDCYAQALLMGCRCIELDCWDGQKKAGQNEFYDIIIYHGYTMTSKIFLRDVLHTIRHYAFVTSEYPVILSIEDNCSVPAQRLLAQELKEILGDYLLTQPVNRDETCLPSPAALKKKIIVKHKKLPVESEDLAVIVKPDEFQDTDIISRECVKKGILSLKNSTSHEWTSHVFILFADRLCYLLDTTDEDSLKEDTISMSGDDDREEESPTGFGVKPEEMHVTEEWFHGHCERVSLDSSKCPTFSIQEAKKRILDHKEKGNGLFMIRDSNLFIGDFSLSILHEGKVHHVRIRSKMVDKEKKYYFMENKMCDTLYELVSYYTRHYLTTASFKMVLTTPCPQPQPHLNQPWFSPTADKEKAEELLSLAPEDGAFLVRTSSTDKTVFVLSLKVDGEFWHYRLKRDGRIFVVNQKVFENLNQIIEYYTNREFVRGISLRFPVNEKDISHLTAEMAEARTPGCYMELKDLDKEVQARSLRPYRGTADDELSFPANATITVLRKEEGLWRGRYGSAVGWFPSAHVQEILPEKMTNESSNYNTIELAGTLIERIHDGDRPNMIKISQSAQPWLNKQHYLLSASSPEEADEWQNNLLDLTRNVNKQMSILRTKEKEKRIAAELSNLVVYCQAVPFEPAHIYNNSFYEMCSFVEGKLEKLIEKGLIPFNTRKLSRVYPNGSRITSANYNPMPMWNAGCHMVALNYQTGDKPMQLNQGKFMANGRCGYVLKPDYMMADDFDPNSSEKFSTAYPIRLNVQVIAGRHLSRKDKNKGICSPFVEIEVCGMPCDSKTYRTKTIASNGLNPIWNQTFTFEIMCPEVALLRFYVEDGDFVGPKTDPFIGQAVFPVDSIRCGFRSVPLKNQCSEELELSALLVDVQMCSRDGSKLIRSSCNVLQDSRLAQVFVNRKATNGDSIPREMAPRLRGAERSIESPTHSESRLPLLEERQLDSQDSTESADKASIASSTVGKKKPKWLSKLSFQLLLLNKPTEKMLQFIILGYLVFEILRLSQLPDVNNVKFVPPTTEAPKKTTKAE
ncbi:unnamed protein product [Caenorhabditis bovis]|uniref:Phosphoinositide phospholipase C n=1 Tax=Caenorhabditis bovis TaxID=2654633 RepID=A0A8S1F4D1_9PELO|nr:unnamed protein product [Caenorhabditis bovis]